MIILLETRIEMQCSAYAMRTYVRRTAYPGPFFFFFFFAFLALGTGLAITKFESRVVCFLGGASLHCEKRV